MEDAIRKAKGRYIRGILLCLLGAAACVAVILFQAKRVQPRDDSELTELTDASAEGDYVALELQEIPVLMTTQSDDEKHRFYYVTATDEKVWLVWMNTQTQEELMDTWDQSTGKLSEPYQITGTLRLIDEGLQNGAIANAYKVFYNEELTADNFADYLGTYYIEDSRVTAGNLDGYKSLALFALLLIVVAVGYLLPALLKVCKGNFGIRDEQNMRKKLDPYVPAGETLLAAVHVISLKKITRQVYAGCRYTEDALIPDANGQTLLIEKSKHATHDMYIGMTKNNLIVKEAEECNHAYRVSEVDMPGAKPISAPVKNDCMGTCFPLELVSKCSITSATGKGMLKCTMELSDGSLFQFKLAKKAGPGMPHHEQDRQKLLDFMERYNR